MKLSTALERLLLYKVNRSISRGETARIKAHALERELAGYRAAAKEFTMWAERYPNTPYLAVVNEELIRIDNDLRLTDLTRARKSGLALSNGLRILRTKLPPEEVRKYDNARTTKKVVSWGIGLIAIVGVLGHLSSKNPASPATPTTPTPIVRRAEPVATPLLTPTVVQEPNASPSASPTALHRSRLKPHRSHVARE